MNTSGNTALVLGASGGIGGEVARQMREAGWQVRALRRTAGSPGQGITWIRGDAIDAADVARAAEGCDVIVHAVNPPGYRDWDRLVLPMLDNTVAAAIAQRATIVLPGTVYNFGSDAFPLLRESSPQNPVTRKGAIRVQMERRLEAASRHGARAIVVRAGDFFGPKPGSSWFSQGLIKPGKTVRTVSNPAAPGVGHQWAYLPDVARTMVQLLAKADSLAPFERFNMEGHWDGTGQQMAESIQRVVGAATGRIPRIAGFPWWLVPLAAPFMTTMREMLEMRYLWKQEVRMANDRLLQVLGHEPRTPLDEAVEATLRGLGCLGSPAALSAHQPAP